jgi:subtilase family serine protease
MKQRKFVLALSVTSVCAGTLFGAVGSQAASGGSSGRTVLEGTAAPAAARTHKVGSVSGSSPVNFELVLNLQDESGAKALAQAISTPGSSSYRQYLTAAQWEARFSPTPAQVDEASAWLRSEGFSVGAISADRLTIAASGTAAQVQSAFGTSLGTYRVAGQTLRMAANDLSVPSAIAGVVAGAMGINQTPARPSGLGDPDTPGAATSAGPVGGPGQFPPPPAAYLTPPPCGAYYAAASTKVQPPFGQGYPKTVPDVVCGYTPPQLRSAYGVRADTGKGVTVAVVDAYDSATITSDATRYFHDHDPGNPFAKVQFSQIDTTPFDQESACDAPSWISEQALDIEAVHGMAPAANIVYVGAQNCFDGLFDAEQNVIDNHLADVVTNSWDDYAGDLVDDAGDKSAYDSLFMMAASTGITILFASGDLGDNFYVLGVSAANYPASSPWVTSAGGTTLQIGSRGQRIGELGWNTGISYLCDNNVQPVLGCKLNRWTAAFPDAGSGGYTSYYYPQPSYQAGIVPLSLSERNSPAVGPVPMRVVPDISLDADADTGFLIGLHQTFPDGTVQYSEPRYGGTSLASPLLAGLVADADQAASVPAGFINPMIYRLDSNPSAIFDVLPEPSLEANWRLEYAGPLGLGFVTSQTATTTWFVELYYNGLEVYCDGTGNCASRPETQSAASGYDSLTGLGSPGPNFITALAGPGPKP